ncbi:MAG: protein phosphatase 2C domain-containing protein [Erysipelotrichaceae bacterium]|nr:protein phosphatase 2C domain-containing protein [Erysipelotrichaceae bacterium]
MILESASIIGPLHQAYGIPNQDFGITFQTGSWYGGVVCDGVSLNSKRQFSNSEIASAWCADFIRNFMEENLRDADDLSAPELLLRAFRDCERGLRDWLSVLQIPYYDCQTTVILMLLHKGSLYGALAGDGGIVYQRKSGAMGMMITKDKTSPSVHPICDPAGWRFSIADAGSDPIVKAMAATDGIFDEIYQLSEQGRTLNGDLILDFFSISTVEKDQQAVWLREKTASVISHDDRTVALIAAEENPD